MDLKFTIVDYDVNEEILLVILCIMVSLADIVQYKLCSINTP